MADSPDSSHSQETPDWLDAWGALWMRGFFGTFPEGVEFGDDEFDLRKIRDALRQVEKRTAPKLEERLKPNLVLQRSG